jgi:dihydrofolate synthase/folylpolyglutamate synthase
MSSLDYLQAVQFLDSLSVEQARHLSLKRTAHILSLVGNPHQGLEVFHVGGTSGKGSVVTFIAEIMRSTGFRMGVNISPYLQVPIERIRVNELYISTKELAELTSRVKPLAEAMLEEGRYGHFRYLELSTGRISPKTPPRRGLGAQSGRNDDQRSNGDRLQWVQNPVNDTGDPRGRD